MDVVYECCCGVDVHQKMIVACLKQGRKQQLRQFGTLTGELKELANWLLESGCQMVAMESTGSYWNPIYNVFEILGLPVIVVNASHMKALPGRKTDVKDAEWIADLLQHGLLKASYIPDRQQRELREISRYRKSLVEERAREINCFQKMLEGANIKLGNVTTSMNGKSAINLIHKFITDGKIESKEAIEDLVYGNLRYKLDEIMLAMDGIMTTLQRKLLKQVLDHIDDMTRRISSMDEMIQEYLGEYEDAVNKIDELPGIGKTSAETIIAEIGIDMSRFPTAAHISSWSGLSPGNNESAGKRKNGRTCKGNKTLKSTLIQCAKSAQKVKQSFFHAQYERLVVRRGKNRATTAVAHSMLIAIYHMLKENVEFKDLGSDYYSRFNKEKKIESYLKKLKSLGWEPSALAI